MMTESKTLDARGLRCPLPVLKARKALKDLADGDILRVLATDPGAVKDFEAFCRTTGHRLLESRAGDGAFDFTIEKMAPPSAGG
jgi:tRNA 2-thiouridine synthesizing protein A